MTIFFGALTLGSVIWGKLASLIGLETTHFVAAAAAAAVIPLTWRWKLQTGAGLDLTPSMHWPAPITTREIEHDRGPVLVTIEAWSLRPYAVEREPARRTQPDRSMDW